MVRAVTPLRRPAPATSPIAAADLAAAARLAETLAAEEAVGTNSPTMGQSDPAVAQAEAIWDALGVLEAKDFDVSIPSPVPLWRRREAQIGGLAALAACLVGAIWIYGQTGVRVFATGAGERRVVALADGSQLELNTRSRLEVRVSARRRWARLVEGEALFTVATRPDHQPFTVDAGAASIRVTGTQFNVRKTTDQTRVDLLEGSVEVRGRKDAPSARLRAGQAVQVSASGDIAVREPADVAGVRDWRAGRLTLTRARLDKAVADINRYATKPVALAEPALGELTVDGVFEARDTRAFARAVSTLHGLKLHENDDRLVLSER